ncbi:hypothetical protein ACFL43_03900 [Thermodesulfobacteriota bacterium]
MNNRTKTYLRKKALKKAKKATGIIIGIIVVFATFFGASASAQAFSFKFGNYEYDVGLGGVSKTESVQPKKMTTEKVNTKIHERNHQEEADVLGLVDRANNDPYLMATMKSFEGDNFCLSTERRIAYGTVNVDGSMRIINEKPEKCYQIKTSEGYLLQAQNKVRNGQLISEDEIKDNVKIPWSLKTKLLFSGLLS